MEQDAQTEYYLNKNDATLDGASQMCYEDDDDNITQQDNAYYYGPET